MALSALASSPASAQGDQEEATTTAAQAKNEAAVESEVAEAEAAAAVATEAAAAAEAAAAKVQAAQNAATEEARKLTVDWSVMASGSYMFNAHRVAGPNGGGFPYTDTHGFNLTFVGGAVTVGNDKVSATLDLRLGAGAGGIVTQYVYEEVWGVDPDTTSYQVGLSPIAPIKQAFFSYSPTEDLQLDLGFFDTVFGAEVADEWNNVNYSRGALYFTRQPFNHMGARLHYDVSEMVGLNFIVGNGGVFGSTPIDDNEVPSFGWQVALSPTDEFNFVFGGMHGANGSNGNKDWEHLFDVVATYSFDKAALIFNSDIQLDPHTAAGSAVGYGFSLAGAYYFDPKWSVGARAEYLGGNNAFTATKGLELVTGTLTARYSPVEALTFSLEPRFDYHLNGPLFITRGGQEDWFFGAILGASVHFEGSK